MVCVACVDQCCIEIGLWIDVSGAVLHGVSMVAVLHHLASSFLA